MVVNCYIDNIFFKNKYLTFIENVINYSLILKEVKVTPFVKIKNKSSLNVINEIQINLQNKLNNQDFLSILGLTRYSLATNQKNHPPGDTP